VRLRVSEREDPALHRERIAQAQRLILDGDVYLVNLARRFAFEISGSAIDLLQQLGQVTVPPFGAYLQLDDTAVVSTSPELFLRLTPDRRVLTAPIKGTRPRAPESARDAEFAAQLGADPKEQSELAMVVDVERNDLGRVAEIGSVQVVSPGSVVSCGTVWHRVAEVRARLALPHGREALLRATAPSGSVTGAPKVRAMEVIAELEAHRRGLYTGALGCVSHQGGLTLAMAIRTLTLREGVAHYHAGGGIVLESDPAFELQETEWKAAQLLRLCAGSD
jgi:anthranilate/para-aminobenzoate synthase component I